MKFYSVIIQMKATEQYFPVVLTIMLHKVVLTFESTLPQCEHLFTIYQYFHMVLLVF